MISSSLYLTPSGPELARVHEPRPRSSIPIGSSITPSTDTNCDTTIRLIAPPGWMTTPRLTRIGTADKVRSRAHAEDQFDRAAHRAAARSPRAAAPPDRDGDPR